TVGAVAVAIAPVAIRARGATRSPAAGGANIARCSGASSRTEVSARPAVLVVSDEVCLATVAGRPQAGVRVAVTIVGIATIEAAGPSRARARAIGIQVVAHEPAIPSRRRTGGAASTMPLVVGRVDLAA